MVNTTLLLHANILYAEIPFKNIPKVVENSYIPVINVFLKKPEIKVVLKCFLKRLKMDDKEKIIVLSSLKSFVTQLSRVESLANPLALLGIFTRNTSLV